MLLPGLKVISNVRAGKIIYIPAPLPTAASYYRAMRWLYDAGRAKKSKSSLSLVLAQEISDILETRGSALKMKSDLFKATRAAKINLYKRFKYRPRRSFGGKKRRKWFQKYSGQKRLRAVIKYLSHKRKINHPRYVPKYKRNKYWNKRYKLWMPKWTKNRVILKRYVNRNHLKLRNKFKLFTTIARLRVKTPVKKKVPYWVRKQFKHEPKTRKFPIKKYKIFMRKIYKARANALKI